LPTRGIAFPVLGGKCNKSPGGPSSAVFAKQGRAQNGLSIRYLLDYDGSAAAEDPKKYDIKTLMNSGGHWGSYFYAGGC
jgi:hypothetical protein